MSAKAVFSNDYYTNPCIFWKNAQSETFSDGGTKVSIGSNGFFNFWEYRNTHACVDGQGTVSTIPFSLFEDIRRYLDFSQNQDLIAVHQKLKHLQSQLQNPLSPELQAFKSEVHEKKIKGATFLTVNLNLLSARFEAGNAASQQCSTFLKVVNFIRKLLNLQPIEHYIYDPIDMEQFSAHVIRPAMELTHRERVSTKYFPLIQLNSNLPLPRKLTRENMHKLELGFMDRISFHLDGKDFCITYNKSLQQFVFSYINSENAPSFSLDDIQPFSHRSDPLDVVEKKLGGSTQVHPLKYSIELTASGWFNSSYTYARSPGDLKMSANCEYTIPLSQGNLNIKMYPRIN